MIDDVSDVVEAEQRAQLETQSRQLEARQRVTERLDSLGRMAGGVAHDFNNILGAMLGYLNFAIETVTDEAQLGHLDTEVSTTLLDDLRRCLQGGQRAGHLTQQLLAFGRRDVVRPVLLDLNSVVRDASGSAAASFTDHGVDLTIDLADDVEMVKADPGQLTQVVHNLLSNAREATPGGGTVTISTKNAHIGEEAASDRLPSGRYVRLTVSDSGRGMPPDVLENAVEPFFTTKPGGKTAGLGLATVHGVVNQSGGDLTIASRQAWEQLSTCTSPPPGHRTARSSSSRRRPGLPAGLKAETRPCSSSMTRRTCAGSSPASSPRRLPCDHCRQRRTRSADRRSALRPDPLPAH